MIDLRTIRAAVRACTGDAVAFTKAQVEQLLDEAEAGQAAQRQLATLIRDASNDAGAGIVGVSPTAAAA